MKSQSSLFKIIFEIIVLVIVAIFIAIFIEAIIGVIYGKDVQYQKYTDIISQIINGENNQLLINDYDPQYVPVLVVKDENYYLYMFKCNYNINSYSLQIPLWNVSSLGSSELLYLFAPDLTGCRVIKEDEIGSCSDKITINITSLGGSAGYLAVLSSGQLLEQYSSYLSPYLGVRVAILAHINGFSNLGAVYVYNQTIITCNCGGCEINNQPLECYLSNGNIEGCAELIGFIAPTEYNLNIQGYPQSFGDYLAQSSLNINGNNISYYSLIINEFVENPVLLIEKQNGRIVFYYSFNTK
ncbi:MAG: hypothetical protein ACP5GJ_00705 [Nanopusillaceae archaeon]